MRKFAFQSSSSNKVDTSLSQKTLFLLFIQSLRLDLCGTVVDCNNLMCICIKFSMALRRQRPLSIIILIKYAIGIRSTPTVIMHTIM